MYDVFKIDEEHFSSEKKKKPCGVPTKLQWEETLSGSPNLNAQQASNKVGGTPTAAAPSVGTMSSCPRSGHRIGRPRTNVRNILSSDIYCRVCEAVSAQLSRTPSFDVRGFDAASDVPPTRLHRRGNGKGRICQQQGKKKKGLKGDRDAQRKHNPSARETHSVTQSLALQMTAIGSVNGPHASGPESEHCPGTARRSYCTAECGSAARSPVLCSARNPLWICAGFKAFLLSQPNVKVRM